ncbi:GNAT family N-acetyltransferase, partial [Kitasatospora phosalacinea]|uniref:GNAT family N-acetyltransferase n=1 Tax=Kitasatospora phosalacinea TaxID=2065 RepID=UPI0035DFB8D1
DDTTRHHCHGPAGPMPDQRKHSSQARKDNSHLLGQNWIMCSHRYALKLSTVSGQLVARQFANDDSVEDLTGLLHRAYASHAAAGRVFFASYQSAEVTAIRLGKGECWLALRGDELAGTVTLTASYQVPDGYPAPARAGSFWQLAVDPVYRGTGLGQRLLTLAESRITALGGTEVVIDTSVEAVELVEWYRRRGYQPVGTWRWDVTNYESVVLRKDLAGAEKIR